MTSEELPVNQPAAEDDSEKRSDDTLWKEILSGFFHDALRSVLPEMAEAVDPLRPIRFLDAELRRLARFTRRYSETPPDGRRFVDILADVPLKKGDNAWILLHAEVQGRGGKEDFPLRMHRYR